MLTPEQLKVARERLGIQVPDSPIISNVNTELNEAWGENASPFQDTLKDAVVGTAKDTFKDLQSNIDQTVEGSKNPDGSINPLKAAVAIPTGAAKSVLRVGSGVVEGAGKAVMDVVSKFIPEEVKESVSEKASDFMEKAVTAWNTRPDESTDPEAAAQYDRVHKMTDRIIKLAKDNPEVTQSLGDAFNVVTSALGGEALTSKTVKNIFEKTLVTVDKKITSLGEKVLAKTKKIASKGEKSVDFDVAVNESKKIMNPSNKYTPTEVEKLRSRGEVKTEGKGVFKKEVADPKTTSTHETLAELVQEGKIKSSNLPNENIKIIKQEARINDANIDEIVNRPDLNKPFTKNTINKVFDGIENTAKKDLIFVADSTEEKIYKAVIDVAREEIGKNSLNSSGLRKSIKAFNARMEEILGKDIYTGASESVGNARLQAAKDIRHSLSDFLAENLESAPIKIDKTLANTKVVNKLPAKSAYETGKLQGGEVYRAQLRREAQLLNAADEIAYRTRGTLNKMEIQKWLDAHPKIKKSIKYGATAVGGKIGLDLLIGD